MENKYKEMLVEEWEKFNKEPTLLPNIMLLGETGSGKSSLINRVFGIQLAEVNNTSRGTEGFEKYEGKKYKLGVNLIDSKGYELSDGEYSTFEKYLDDLNEEMKKSRNADPLDKIHIIWYCISATGQVVQNYDIEIIKALLNDEELKMRVCVVLTKCDKDRKDRSISEALKKVIRNEAGEKIPVFCVSNNPDFPLELDELMQWSAEQLDDDDMREAFIQSQVASLKTKRVNAGKIIGFHAAAAAAIGASPIPVPDTVILTPLQVEMTVNIIRSYGMDNMISSVKSVVNAVIIPNIAKSLAANLLKVLPGFGEVINATVASSITTALGCTVSQICYVCCEKIAKGEEVDFGQEFSAENLSAAAKYFSELVKNKGRNDYISSEKANERNVQNYTDSYLKKYGKGSIDRDD